MKSIIDRLLSKPEWQNPDPAARAEAVLRLPSTEGETLLAIARDDAEPRVRRAAVRKLADPEVLSDLARSDDDEGVRDEAVTRLVHLASHATEEATANAALAALGDPRHLATVVRSASRPALRDAALAALSDPRALATVVREAEDPALRLAALGRIDDEATLLALALKSDQKAVATAAVDRLETAESLQTVADAARAGAAARRARSRLERGESPASESPATPATAEEVAREREAYERARAEQEKEAAVRAEAIAAREALCVAIEAAEGESIPAEIERIRGAWVELAPLTGDSAPALDTRFEESAAAAAKRHETFAAGLARRDELAALVAEAETLAAAEDAGDAHSAWSALENRWAALAASADQPDLSARYDQAAAKHRERQRATREEGERKDRKNLARLIRLADRAEELLTRDERSLRDFDHVSRDLKAALDHPGHFPTREDRERVLARLEAARKGLYPLLQQLREDAEWKRWANVAVQEDLCGRTEALADEEDLDRAAQALRDIDAAWKQAKEAPKEKAEALWTRFKAARDTVRERLDAHFARQAEELAENLKKKEALCERAEAHAESSDWTKTADLLRGLQAEWKTLGPVPRAQSRRIWERFRKPCDQFFTRWQEHRGQRDQEWTENLKKKEALCEKAESLMDSADWDTVSGELKRLQTEWRAIGAVKKTRSDAIWRRFQNACDHFFERYKHRDALALEVVRTDPGNDLRRPREPRTGRGGRGRSPGRSRGAGPGRPDRMAPGRRAPPGDDGSPRHAVRRGVRATRGAVPARLRGLRARSRGQPEEGREAGDPGGDPARGGRPEGRRRDHRDHRGSRGALARGPGLEHHRRQGGGRGSLALRHERRRSGSDRVAAPRAHSRGGGQGACGAFREKLQAVLRAAATPRFPGPRNPGPGNGARAARTERRARPGATGGPRGDPGRVKIAP